MTNRHHVAVLVLPGVLPLEFGTATQIFAMDPHYEMTVCGDTDTGLVPGCGFAITVAAGLEALGDADTVIIPGYDDIDATPSAELLVALRAAHARGARLVSICTAAFVLAAAGLLDGRPATTHWRHAEQLRQRYPHVDVVPNQLYVDDGDILTSAGVTAGIDLCLHLIRTDLGAAAANTHARGLVAPPRRRGGQAQFVEQFRPEASADELAPLREWMLDNLAKPLTIDHLAERAHMSRRTLIRRFSEETGTPPITWLTDARIDRARELLETTTVPIEQIGRLTGLGAPASLRAAFHRRVGTSPQEYRTLFRHKDEMADA
ncbi:helix-turn-helix domain-containing protein [Streptomyces sp. KM273126]|uniref:GlxA family transcriptional regulator n=1 Tax=Streptomyces sp. KM273126 TaxID=2545247 RepID=UPI00103E5A9B|nr:helix-turn-helix domain-containing protein [Streptomyces sp. KM273126]MBA2811396.1 helix-turn-helix domain-containing protein [Streptomyces sp. KM273126]